MANEIKIILGADSAPLKAGLQDAQRSMSSFTTQLNKVVPGANTAAFALQNVGRVAQDLPFGFIGIQNNLNPLLESFIRLKQETGSSSSALKAMVSSLAGAGGLGFALSLASSAIVILQNGIAGFNRKTKDAADHGKEFADSIKTINDITAQASGSVDGQVDTIRKLASEITNTNISYAERKRALQELQSINKSYFGDLTLEASKLAVLSTRVQEYTNAIVAEAVTKGFKDEISKVTQEINAQNEVYKQLKKSAEDAQSAQDNFKGSRSAIIDPKFTNGVTVLNDAYLSLVNKTDDANDAVASQAALLDDLNNKYGTLREGLNSSVDELIKFKSLDTPGETKKTTDALKERVSVLKELIEAGVDVKKNQFELRNLEIRIFLRDAKTKGITEEEKQAYVDSISNNFKFSNPIPVDIPLSVSFAITEADPAGDNLEQGIERMIKRLQDAGARAGNSFRKGIVSPFESLNAQLQGILTDSLTNIGEALGEAFAGGDPARAFVGVISEAIVSIGKALIAYGIATHAAELALSNPIAWSTALLAGIAAVAAGTALKGLISNPQRLAFGGVTQGPTLAMIGEAGREVVMPLDKLSSIIGDRTETLEPIESFIRGTDIVTMYRKMSKRMARCF